MSVSIPAFWKLLADSRLLAPQQCQQLATDFAQLKGSPTEGSARPLAEWLVSRNVLSRYQTAILLAGRSGPFYYGDYKVYDRVDKGRLAGLFRAVHIPTGHPVLLQFLAGDIIRDPNRWAAAAQETLAASNIVSPFLPRYYEPVDLQTFKFVVLEDLRGVGVEERLQGGRLPPAEACRIVRMAAVGLAQMHAAGRVHGDIRPGNLFLDTTTPNHPGHTKLLYEAHQAPGPVNFADVDPAGRLAKMADYLAPELMQPGRAPDPLSDVYALGCTLYSLLTGNPPFAGGDLRQKFQRHATEAIRPLEAFGISPPLSQLVPYLMAKNPGVRFQSAAMVAEQLAPLVDPALVNSYPTAVPPTLPNYDHWLRQKRQHMAASMAPPQPAFGAPAAPAVNLNLGGRGPVVAAAAPAAPAFPAVGVNLNTGSSGGGGSAAAAIYARRKAQKQRNMIIGSGLSLVLLLVLGFVGWKFMGAAADTDLDDTVAMTDDSDASPDVEPSTAPPITPTTNTAPVPGGATNSGLPGSAPLAGSGSGPIEIVPDDGELLWASPTSGQPPSFRLVPLDGQAFIAARPSEILASPDGAKTLDALGPSFASQREAWEKASGFQLSEVKQVILSLHPNDAKFPRVSLVVTPKEKLSREQLLQRWGNPAEAKEGEATYYTGAGWAFYLPADAGDDATFLMGDVADVKEVASSKRSAPPLMLNMERLRKGMDDDRHFSLLFRPAFLFNDDGEPLFAGERAKVKEPLRWLLGDGVEAGLVSMHFGSEFYFESRMLGSLSKDKYQLAKEMRERLQEVPNRLTDYFVTLTPPPYWKKLSFLYPQMVARLHDNMRVGVESEQAVVNSVLPAAAAHNLVLGGELLIATAPGATAVAGPAAPAATGPKTIEELLNQKTTLTFDAMAFDSVMAQLQSDGQELAKGTPFGKGGPSEFTIKILGNDDLRPEGITQQQTVRDFKQENKTLAEILTAMVMKANPVTTVKEPTETDQKLIWVVGPDPDNPSKQMVLITTRSAAARKNYKLPDVFVPKG